MNVSIVFPLLAIAAGAVLPVQAGANAILKRGVGGFPPAVLVSLTVSALLMFAWVLAARYPAPDRADLMRLPPQAWLGGVLGATYLISVTIAAPSLGSATTVALVVLGQALSALALDHFGLMGFAEKPVTLLHAGGVLLIAGGAFAVSWND
ncbi:MAG TPA: DMT family transporter [Hansschlegelia sp.]